MGVAYINPMTGQQINLLKGAKKPAGCWTAIGEVADEKCLGYVKQNVIMQTVPIVTTVNDTDMSVGNDFTEEDDQF